MAEPMLSIVIPCLNEADTLGICLRDAVSGISTFSGSAEIVVADNGSTDASAAIAAAMGARVVSVPERGYGAALMAGISAARGQWIIIADADASYSLSRVQPFLDSLALGNDLVMGCRLPAGGGRVAKGAMPYLHRWVGNPLFSALARLWFKAPIHDVNCGMRGFTKELIVRLDLQCTGMEFATEMVIKASLGGARIAEVPITLFPDQRRAHAPHLRTFRDGWRTLRFYLLFSPRWLFGVPGILLLICGVVAAGLAFPGVQFGGIGFDVHTLLFAGFFMLLGMQMVLFGVLAKAYAVAQGLLPSSSLMLRATKWLRLETGIVSGVACSLLGVVLLVAAFLEWRAVDFGALDYGKTMRLAIPGVTLAAIGVQIILASFLLGVFSLPRRRSTAGSLR